MSLRGSLYQRTIHEIDTTVNPAGVEAMMRTQYGTLGHLDRETFAREIGIAKSIAGGAPDFMRRAARSWGLENDFDEWEQKLKETT